MADEGLSPQEIQRQLAKLWEVQEGVSQTLKVAGETMATLKVSVDNLAKQIEQGQPRCTEHAGRITRAEADVREVKQLVKDSIKDISAAVQESIKTVRDGVAAAQGKADQALTRADQAKSRTGWVIAVLSPFGVAGAWQLMDKLLKVMGVG